MINQKFGKWTVINEAPKKETSRAKQYTCICECGAQNIVAGSVLRSGNSTQCYECRMKKLRIDSSDWIGKRFGEWLVLDHNAPINNYKSFLCECKCGEKRVIPATYLKRGKTKACNPCAVKTHGKKGNTIYNIWNGLKARCLNPNEPAYNHYGGRGIKVCERWLKFENFYADMGDRPKGLQIDRTNNDGDYSPDNCKWVTPKENTNNRRCSKKNNPTTSIF